MIRFGIAGYPPAYLESPFRKDRMKIFEWLHQLGLDAFEAQMTYGPRTSPENCRLMHTLAEAYGISISVHAAYYIVLTSSDSGKVRRSIDMLKKTFELADLMGANTVVLHPGPCYKTDPARIADTLCQNLNTFFREIGTVPIGLFLETAGKKGQFGSVEEIFTLSREVKGCYPCIDFGHVHARTDGSLSSPAAIDQLFADLRENGAFRPDSRIHFHYTPIHYGPQGEICHKAIEDTCPENHQTESDLQAGEHFYHPRYEAIARNLRQLEIPLTIISETHNSQERGALALKKSYLYTGSS